MRGVHLGSRADVAAEQRVSLLFGPNPRLLSPPFLLRDLGVVVALMSVP
jgi:hypothetical protein